MSCPRVDGIVIDRHPPVERAGDCAEQPGRDRLSACAYETARARDREALAIGREIHDRWTVVHCLSNLGEVCFALEDEQAARTCLADALHSVAETGIVPVLPEGLANVGRFLAGKGKARAGRLAGRRTRISARRCGLGRGGEARPRRLYRA